MAKQALSFLTGGLNEVSRPDLIADDQLSESLNYIIDGAGRLVKRSMIKPYSVPIFGVDTPTGSYFENAWLYELGYPHSYPQPFADSNTFPEFFDTNINLQDWSLYTSNIKSEQTVPADLDGGDLFRHLRDNFERIIYVSEPYYPTQKPDDMVDEFEQNKISDSLFECS